MSFGQLRLPAFMRSALALGVVAGLAAAGHSFMPGDAPAFAAPALAVQVAQKDTTADKPATGEKTKKTPRTRWPTTCGPWTSITSCGKSGGIIDDSLGFAVPV
jgi:hypothetical protein